MRMLLLSVLCLFLLACSQDRDDPLGPGGATGLMPGADRANQIVDDANKYEASLVILKEIVYSFRNGLNTLIGNPAADGGQTVRTVGYNNGWAQTALDSSRALGAGSGVSWISLGYYDYSDTGMQFLAGSLSFEGEWVKDDTLAVNSCEVSGRIECIGDYQANLKFEILWIDFEANIPRTRYPEQQPPYFAGRMTIYSADNDSIQFNPFEPLVLGVDVPIDFQP